MREASKSMDFSLPASFSPEALNLLSSGLIWTYGSLVISPIREEDLNTSQIKLIFIHVVLTHPEEITLCRFMGNALHTCNHRFPFYITDDTPFQTPRMVSGSYELKDCFQELVRIDSSKIGTINCSLCCTMLKITMKDKWEVTDRIEAVHLFLSMHKS